MTLEECNDTIDGYSWGSKINVLIFAPAWNSEKNKIDTLGDDDIFRIGAYSDTSRQKGPCKFVETDVNSGLFAADVIGEDGGYAFCIGKFLPGEGTVSTDAVFTAVARETKRDGSIATNGCTMTLTSLGEFSDC